MQVRYFVRAEELPVYSPAIHSAILNSPAS
jgi:hypothetical protein